MSRSAVLGKGRLSDSLPLHGDARNRCKVRRSLISATEAVMVKPKSRSARKQQRKSAVRATERGLPAATLRTRAEVAKQSSQHSGAAGKGARRSADARQGAPAGMPTVLKVALGAAVALGLVYAASLLRKSEGPPPSNSDGETSKSDAQ